MDEGIDKQHLMQVSKAPLPLQNRLLPLMKHAGRGIQSQALGPGFQHRPNLTHWRAQTGENRLLRFGTIGATVVTPV